MNTKSRAVSELETFYKKLQSFINDFDNSEVPKQLDRLEEVASRVGKAWGHSWLGYQSRVYYSGLSAPPPGMHFSSEWGFSHTYGAGGTHGDWEQYPEDAIEGFIRKEGGNPDLANAQKLYKKGSAIFEDSQHEVLSILRSVAIVYPDTFIDKLTDEIERIKQHTALDYVSLQRPRGQVMTRDTLALSQGVWTPPHIAVEAETIGYKDVRQSCDFLAKHVRRAFSHLERTKDHDVKAERIGTNVFIGHGRSKEWKDLKDFVSDRLRLPWDEFNRKPVAGIPNTVRLSSMLDSAAIAFLVLTAEDERTDGTTQARMNVIHEAGLFQGRLGFHKAIIMLEDGCEEFSNVEGLGQLRFPKNNIRAAFHDVQLILEREGLIEVEEADA